MRNLKLLLENPYKFWVPTQSQIIPDKKLSIEYLANTIKYDILMADSMFLPMSYKLVPFQKLSMQAIADHRFVFMQAIRGSGKSYIVARALLVMGLCEKLTITLTGPTYRQALLIFNYIIGLIGENSGPGLPFSLDRELEGNIVTGNMESRIRLKNGTVFKCLPMADGSKLRGERSDILVNDESFKLEREMFKSHILPFLQRPQVAGRPPGKLVLLTSAESQECYAYTLLVDYCKKIGNENELVLENPGYKRKYCVLDWRYDDVAASGIKMDEEINELILHGADEYERDRILNNKWTSVSGQFFPANIAERMRDTSVHIEHERNGNCSYGLSVDVATSKVGDYFVIHTWKFPGNQQAYIVNSHWERGLNSDEMALRVHDYNEKFNPNYIVIDKGGGGLYLVSSLSKRKLIDSKNREHIVKNPILLHNDLALDGQKKIILNKPADELVRRALAGARQRGGEEIKTEDIFVHLLYDGLRQVMGTGDSLIRIPYGASEEGDSYDRSDVKILDFILESIYQLRFLTRKTVTLPDGTVELVRSKTNKVPMYVWKTSNKDGASALAYGLILYYLEYESQRGGERDYSGPITRPTMPAHSFWGLVEDPSQLENRYATKVVS